MARGLRLSRPVAAWFAVALVLAAPAWITGVGVSRAIDWQPALAFSEPWRWWSASWVHFSRMHLALNLAGIVMVAALGATAPVGPRAALAWLLAWPLTHLGLLSKPELQHYGGLSGVLHAGVAVVVVGLLGHGNGRQRWLGVAIGAALLAKVLLEKPWGPALRYPAGWDIAIAPIAHGSGLLAGALCAALVAVMKVPAR